MQRIIAPIDLSDAAVTAYWRKTDPNPALTAVLNSLDNETSPFEKRQDQLAGLTQTVLQKLQDPEIHDLALISELRIILTAAAAMPASKCLRLLRWIAAERPTLSNGLVEYAASLNLTENDAETMPVAVICQRIRKVKKLLLLDQVFGKERLQRVAEYMKPPANEVH